jgi:pyruvyltransferase
LIDGYLVNFYHDPPKYQNWGDDLNVYLFEKITGKKIIPVKTLLFNKFLTRYSIIGSTIPGYITSKTIIWGSGVFNLDHSLQNTPLAILAVRGPLTRQYFLKYNIDCPEIYGDPALLLPRYYQPIKSKRFKIGLIPHHRDYDIASFDKYLELCEDVTLIDIAHYGDHFFEVIDKICSCDIILSSSLHGLIVADAYGVKNMFCEFEYHHPNYDKYLDYCMSVGRQFENPISIDDALNKIDTILERDYTVSIDLEKMINVCPFNIKNYE